MDADYITQTLNRCLVNGDKMFVIKSLKHFLEEKLDELSHFLNECVFILDVLDQCCYKKLRTTWYFVLTMALNKHQAEQKLFHNFHILKSCPQNFLYGFDFDDFNHFDLSKSKTDQSLGLNSQPNS